MDMKALIYNNDFHTIFMIRKLLSQTLFRDPNFQADFINTINENIDCFSSAYNPAELTYTIKVRKTAIKKLPNFKAEAAFYYNIVGKIIQTMLIKYKDDFIKILTYTESVKALADSNVNPAISAYNLYSFIVSSDIYCINLANVQCISDNIVQIIM